MLLLLIIVSLIASSNVGSAAPRADLVDVVTCASIAKFTNSSSIMCTSVMSSTRQTSLSSTIHWWSQARGLFTSKAIRGESVAQSDVLSLMAWPALELANGNSSNAGLIASMVADNVTYGAKGEPPLYDGAAATGTVFSGRMNSLSTFAYVGGELWLMDAEQATVSFSMRVGKNVRGVAMAQLEGVIWLDADGFMDVLGANPTAQLLSELEGSVPASSMSSFPVIFAVYVDSAKQLIAWASRDEGSSSYRIEEFYFGSDHDEMKLEGESSNPFDGAWHLITFTVQDASASRKYVELFVDGWTSKQNSYRRCVSSPFGKKTSLKPSKPLVTFLESTVTASNVTYVGLITTFGVVESGSSLSVYEAQIYNEIALSQRQVVGLGSTSMIDAIFVTVSLASDMGIAMLVIACFFFVVTVAHALSEVTWTSADIKDDGTGDIGVLATGTANKVGSAVASAEEIGAKAGQLSAQAALKASSLTATASLMSPVRLAQTIAPQLIAGWQNMSLYLRLWTWPESFRNFMAKIAVIFAFDLTLPELRITPSVTFFLQFSACVLLIRFMWTIVQKDRRTFQWNTIRFRTSVEMSVLLAEEKLLVEISPTSPLRTDRARLRRVAMAFVCSQGSHATLVDALDGEVSLTTNKPLSPQEVKSRTAGVALKMIEILQFRDPLEALLKLFSTREDLDFTTDEITVISRRLYAMFGSHQDSKKTSKDRSEESLPRHDAVDVYGAVVKIVNEFLPHPMRASTTRILGQMLFDFSTFLGECEQDHLAFYGPNHLWTLNSPAPCIGTHSIMSLKEMRKSVFEKGSDLHDERWGRLFNIAPLAAAATLPLKASVPKAQYQIFLRECKVDRSGTPKFLSGKETPHVLYRLPQESPDEDAVFDKFMRCLNTFTRTSLDTLKFSSLTIESMSCADEMGGAKPKFELRDGLITRRNGELFFEADSAVQTTHMSQYFHRVERGQLMAVGGQRTLNKKMVSSQSLVDSAHEVLEPRIFFVDVQSLNSLYCPLHCNPVVQAPESIYQRRYADGSLPFQCCHSENAAFKLSRRSTELANKHRYPRGAREARSHFLDPDEGATEETFEFLTSQLLRKETSGHNLSGRRRESAWKRESTAHESLGHSKVLQPTLSTCDGDQLYICPSRCGYTVCQRCYSREQWSASYFVDQIVQEAFTAAKDNPLFFLLLFIAAQSLMYPLTQNCFMVIACHPTFQCDFPGCYSDPSATFMAAVVLSVVVLVVFRCGIALLWTYEIFGRKRLLNGLLIAKHNEPSINVASAAALNDDDDDIKIPLREELDQLAHDLQDEILDDLEGLFVGKKVVKTGGTSVYAFTEDMWEWFLSNDTSILSSLYRKLEFPFMAIDPCLQLAVQVSLSVIAAFTVDDSPTQIIATAAAESSYCLFLSLTNFYADPWLDILAKLGSVHQLFQMAWLSWYRADIYNDPYTQRMTNLMFGTMGLYMTVVVLITYHTVIRPWLDAQKALSFASFSRRDVSACQEEDIGTRLSRLEAVLLEKQSHYGRTHFQSLITEALLFWNRRTLLDGESDQIGDVLNISKELLAYLKHFAQDRHKGANVQKDKVGQVKWTPLHEEPQHLNGYLLRGLTLQALREILSTLFQHSKGQAETAELHALRMEIVKVLTSIVIGSKHDYRMSVAASNAMMLLAATRIHPTARTLMPFVGNDFSGVSIPEAKLDGCSFLNVNFSNANLNQVSFRRCFFDGVILAGASVNKTVFGLTETEQKPLFAVQPLQWSVGAAAFTGKNTALVVDVGSIGFRHADFGSTAFASPKYSESVLAGHTTEPVCVALLAPHCDIGVSIDRFGKVIAWSGFAAGKLDNCTSQVLIEEVSNSNMEHTVAEADDESRPHSESEASSAVEKKGFLDHVDSAMHDVTNVFTHRSSFISSILGDNSADHGSISANVNPVTSIAMFPSASLSDLRNAGRKRVSGSKGGKRFRKIRAFTLLYDERERKTLLKAIRANRGGWSNTLKPLASAFQGSSSKFQDTSRAQVCPWVTIGRCFVPPPQSIESSIDYLTEALPVIAAVSVESASLRLFVLHGGDWKDLFELSLIDMLRQPSWSTEEELDRTVVTPMIADIRFVFGNLPGTKNSLLFVAWPCSGQVRILMFSGRTGEKLEQEYIAFEGRDEEVAPLHGSHSSLHCLETSDHRLLLVMHFNQMIKIVEVDAGMADDDEAITRSSIVMFQEKLSDSYHGSKRAITAVHVAGDVVAVGYNNGLLEIRDTLLTDLDVFFSHRSEGTGDKCAITSVNVYHADGQEYFVLCCYSNGVVERIAIPKKNVRASPKADVFDDHSLIVKTMGMPKNRLVHDIAFSPDNDTVVVCHNEPCITVASMSRAESRTIAATDETRCVVFTGPKDMLTVCKDGVVSWWRDGFPSDVLVCGGDREMLKDVRRIYLSPDGSLILVVGKGYCACFEMTCNETDNTFLVDVTWKLLWESKEFLFAPDCCQFSPDGHDVILNFLELTMTAEFSKGHHVLLVDPWTGRIKNHYKVPYANPIEPDTTLFFNVTVDGGFLVAAAGGEMFFIHTATNRTVEKSQDPSERIQNIAVAPFSGTGLFVSNFENEPISVHFGFTGKILTSKTLHRLTFTPYQRRVVGFCREDNALEGYNVDAIQLPQLFPEDGVATVLQRSTGNRSIQSRVAAAGLSTPDGKQLACVSKQHEVTVWEVTTARLVCKAHILVDDDHASLLASLVLCTSGITMSDARCERSDPTCLAFFSRAHTIRRYREVLESVALVDFSADVEPYPLEIHALCATLLHPLLPQAFAVGCIDGFVRAYRHLGDGLAAMASICLAPPPREGEIALVTGIAVWKYGHADMGTDCIVLCIAYSSGLITFSLALLSESEPEHEDVCNPLVSDALVIVNDDIQPAAPKDNDARPAVQVPAAVVVFEDEDEYDATLGIVLHPNGRYLLAQHKAGAVVFTLFSGGDVDERYSGLEWRSLSEEHSFIRGLTLPQRALSLQFDFLSRGDAVGHGDSPLALKANDIGRKVLVSEILLVSEEIHSYAASSHAKKILFVAMIEGIGIVVDDKEITFFSATSNRLAQLGDGDIVEAPMSHKPKKICPGDSTFHAALGGVVHVDVSEGRMTMYPEPWNKVRQEPFTTKLWDAQVRVAQQLAPAHLLPSIHVLMSDKHYPRSRAPVAAVLCYSQVKRELLVARYRLPDFELQDAVTLDMDQLLCVARDNSSSLQFYIADLRLSAISSNGKSLAVVVTPYEERSHLALSNDMERRSFCPDDVCVAVFDLEAKKLHFPIPIHIHSLVIRYQQYRQWRACGGHDAPRHMTEAIARVASSNRVLQTTVLDIGFNRDGSLVYFSLSTGGLYVVPMSSERRRVLYKDHQLNADQTNFLMNDENITEVLQVVYWPSSWRPARLTPETIHQAVNLFKGQPVPLSWVALAEVTGFCATYILPTFDYAVSTHGSELELHSFRGKDDLQLGNRTQLSSRARGMAVRMPSVLRHSLLPPSRVAVAVGDTGVLEVFAVHPSTGEFSVVFQSTGGSVLRSLNGSYADTNRGSGGQLHVRFEVVDELAIQTSQHKNGGEGNKNTVSFNFHADSDSDDSDEKPAVRQGTTEEEMVNKALPSTQAEDDQQQASPAVVVMQPDNGCLEVYGYASVRQVKYSPSNPNFFVDTHPTNLVRTVVHKGL